MRYALVNGIILDGHRDMKPVSGKAVIVSDGIIEAIVAALLVAAIGMVLNKVHRR